MRRYLTGAVVVTSLAMALTGCTGETGSKSADRGNGGNGGAGNAVKLTAAQVLNKASEKTSNTDTVTATFSMQGSAGGAGQVTANGSMQYRLRPDYAFRMSFDRMSVAGQSVGGMEQRLIGDTMYMKMPDIPGLGSGSGSSKPWLKFSLRELGKKLGVNLQQLMQQSQQMDPVQNIKLLTAAKDSRQVGTEIVDGTQTTHFTGTYSMAEALSKLGPKERKVFAKLSKDSGMEKMAFDLWVDDQQLPRRMTMRTAGSAKESVSITMNFRDYGKPVTIVAPPPNEVADASEFFKGLGGAGRTGGT